MSATADAFLTEYLAIRQQRHVGWAGDPVLNAETFVARWSRANPSLVTEVAAEVEATGGDKLPDSVARRIANDMRRSAA